VALHFVGVLFLFLGIAIVCDDFFVASLEAISEKLKLSEDVAGVLQPLSSTSALTLT
jgi:Ca2+/Na+ antiporter